MMLISVPARFAPVLIIVAALGLSGCGDGAEAEAEAPIVRPVKAVTVEPVAVGLQRSYPAVVLPAQEVELSFRVSGRIVELPIRAATQVKEGDVIAQLDTRDFEAAIAQLESQEAQANAQLRAMRTGARAEDIASLEAAVEASQAQVEAARDQVERTRTLLERGVVTRARLDTDETSLRVAEADLKARQEELGKGQSGSRAEDVEAQEAAIKGLQSQLDTARDNLADATLRAPFGGIIARREVDNFVNIQAKEPIALLQKLETLNLVFDVPGPDVAAISADRISSVAILDAIPGREFDAEFVEFSTQADSATQTYRGRVSIVPPENTNILPGMVGTVIVSEASNGETTISVPSSAVGSDPGGAPFVWLVAPDTNTVTKRAVALGEAAANEFLVTSGLAAGDVIVAAGLSQLQPDMKVRPVLETGD